MEDTSLLNLRHIASCNSLVSTLPQLRLSLGSASSRIKEANKIEAKNNGELCDFCFTSIDRTKANVELTESKKGQMDILTIACHICKKVCHRKEIEKIPEREFKDHVKSVQSRSTDDMSDLSVKKKKKKKKEENAGLIMPIKKVQNSMKPNSSSMNKSSISKDKLKLLMVKSEAPKRGTLQDFLKKL